MLSISLVKYLISYPVKGEAESFQKTVLYLTVQILQLRPVQGFAAEPLKPPDTIS